jgi:amidase
MNELIKLTAREAVSLLKQGEVSPLELIEAAANRIAEVEEAVNAMPTLCLDRARDRANQLMAQPPSNPPPYYLYGLPIAIKDLVDVAGVRTTYGSPIFADHQPDGSDFLVETLEANGAIVLGKLEHGYDVWRFIGRFCRCRGYGRGLAR